MYVICLINKLNGAIAQLGERYAGSVEVRSVNDVVYSAFIKALLNFSKNVATNIDTKRE
jgi:hypothetical protein